MGYSGGNEPDPTYQTLKDHTEAVLIEYNPDMISYEKILKLWGEADYPYSPQKRQYRSGVFYLTEEQAKSAKEFVGKLSAKHSGERKLYVDIEPVTKFYRGEEYHQFFLEKQTSNRGLQMF